MSIQQVARRAIIGLLLLCMMLPLVSGARVFADDLGPTAPSVTSSDPVGSHMFFLRKNSQLGRQTNIYLSAYYENNTQNTNTDNWSTYRIKFKTGPDTLNDGARVCEALGPRNNSRYVTVTLSTETNMKQFHISGSQLCAGDGRGTHANRQGADGRNVFYGEYDLPRRPDPDPRTDGSYYRVDISIEYGSVLDNVEDAGRVRFLVDGQGGGAKIGPQGGAFAFSLQSPYAVQQGRIRNPNGTVIRSTDVRVPFAMECNDPRLSTDPIAVGVYDADNGPIGGTGTFDGNEVTFKIRNTTDNTWVRMEAGSNSGGSFTDSSRETFRPAAGNDKYTHAKIIMNQDKKYEIRVFDVNPANTIDIRVPYGTIYGDSKVCQDDRWNLDGKTYLNDGINDLVAELDVGQTASYDFSHEIKNIGRDLSENFTWSTHLVFTRPSVGSLTSTIQTGGPMKLNGRDSSDRLFLSGAAYKVTIPITARSGDRYCQYIRWTPDRADPTKPQVGLSDQRCVTVIRNQGPPPPGSRLVELRAVVQTGGDTETQGQADFTGYATVSNFPRPEEGGWGYNELSQQLAPVMQPARESSGLNTETRGGTVRSSSSCPSGYSENSSGTCMQERYRCMKADGTWGAWGAWQPVSGSPRDCGGLGRDRQTRTAAHNTNYYCDAGYTYSERTFGSFVVRTCTQNRYSCNGGPWGSWGGAPPSCPTIWTCPGGAQIDGTNTTTQTGGSRPLCDGWKCQYSDTQINQEDAPTCEYRCNGGRGEQAYFDRGDANDWDRRGGSGNDRRCFVAPSFEITCYWDNGQSTTATVTANGRTCNMPTYYKLAGAIGATVCAQLRISNPSYPESWQPSSPLPGTVTNAAGEVRMMNEWHWNITNANGCSRVVGMPYLKVYGSDVRVGGGVGRSADSCNFNNSALIRAYNRSSDYAGAGAQYAVMAMGGVNGFASAQYNSMGANPSPGSNPTRLAFANTPNPTGYGGSWGPGGIPACVGYVDELPEGTVTETGNQTISGTVVPAGTSISKHIVGDVFINSDIVYSPGWGTVDRIPQYQLVVEGNIYIAPNVTRLDGLFAAAPTTATNGKIYTCATGIGAIPTAAFTGCRQQLVVNGGFVARQIYFLRDCGSLRQSTTNEPVSTNHTGGVDPQQCSVNNHAAEVFNYSPELWIRSAAGATPDTYDAISSLPPIL